MTLTTTPHATGLLDALRLHGADPGLRDRAARLGVGADRDWERLSAPDDDVEVWLVSWPVASGTGWHEHRRVQGAFTTLRGRLTEYTWDGVVHARTLLAGQGRSFDVGHVHDVVNERAEPALSLHAYAPHLAGLTRYELVRGRLEAVDVAGAGVL